jgi:hypothetical protein
VLGLPEGQASVRWAPEPATGIFKVCVPGLRCTEGEETMSIKDRIRHLAEQDGLTLEEAEDILLDAAESENDRRRDDALETNFSDNDE